MRLLLDTQVFLWWISDSQELSRVAKDAIADEEAEVLVSVVTVWEMVIKTKLGKLPLPELPGILIPKMLERHHFQVLPVTLQHTLKVYDLPDFHKDPFDRLLMAQAITEDLVFVTSDAAIKKYGLETLW
jgi:PIN domain nuclease of toxin-antitoxin system